MGLTQVDVRTAAFRALRDYLKKLTWTIEGKETSFREVYESWPDPQREIKLPSVSLLLIEARFDFSSFTPFVVEETVNGESGEATFQTGEWIADLQVDVWAREQIELDTAVRALEDAFNPDPDRYGLTLPLPLYLDQKGRFTLNAERPNMTEDRALASIRRTTLTVTVEVPYVRHVTGLPLLKPKVQIYVGESVDVAETSLSVLQQQGGD